MRIDQVVVGASLGDAITTIALNTRSLLRETAPSDLYGLYIDVELHHNILELKNFRPASESSSEDVIIFHASIGERKVEEFIRDRPERIVLMYHNVSPSEPFVPYDPAFADLLVHGREIVAGLANRVDVALAASEFNASELRDMGFKNVRVSPPLLSAEDLVQLQPDWGTDNHISNNIEGPIVLSVGQLLPHKRPELLLEAFHTLVTYLHPNANLIMVGANRLRSFAEVIEEFNDELNLSRVWITGSVSQAQLASFYRAADLFVTTSDHEGFCVPLIEAMRFKVPIVARASGAIPETLGDAGLLIPPDAGPELLAEAMAAVIDSETIQNDLTMKGQKRAEEFSLDSARNKFLQNMASFSS